MRRRTTKATFAATNFKDQQSLQLREDKRTQESETYENEYLSNWTNDHSGSPLRKTLGQLGCIRGTDSRQRNDIALHDWGSALADLRLARGMCPTHAGWSWAARLRCRRRVGSTVSLRIGWLAFCVVCRGDSDDGGGLFIGT